MRKRVYIKPIGIMVSEEMYDGILEICDQEELAISDYVRSAIEFKQSQDIKDKNPSTKE